MMPLRLRTRLTLWFAASIVLIVTPILVAVLILQSRAMRKALDHHLEEDLEVAVEMLDRGNSGITWRSQRERDYGYDAGPQRWVEVFDEGRRRIFARGPASRPDIQDALAPPDQRPLEFRTFATPSGARVRSLTAERTLGPARVWIRVVRSEDDLRRDLRRLVVIFSVVVPLSIVLAAGAGHVIAGRALLPLTRMAERAREISAERLSARLPVENPEDEPGQLALVFNETFARLETSFAGLKQFTADVSHELRTPLTAIRSVGEVGLREARSAEAYQEIIGSMLEETDHLARVVDTLLTLSRWESGRVRPAPQPIDLRQLAGDLSSQFAVLSDERGIRLRMDIDAPAIVMADPVMTRQAVANVLDNAIKFTPDNTSVRIWSRSTVDERQLIVDDDGPGIPPEERGKVLERFYRVSDGIPRASGAGLGLSIVHWAMTANHGYVAIDAAENGGARVILSWRNTPSSRPSAS